MKLKAKTRFLNAIDAKIYDEGDVFEVKDGDESDYFIDNKLAEVVKDKTKKEDKK